MFFSAEQLRRVVNDRRRRNQDLGRVEAVAARQAAGAKDVARGERLALPPEEEPNATAIAANTAAAGIQRPSATLQMLP
jgi:hypothetical protein